MCEKKGKVRDKGLRKERRQKINVEGDGNETRRARKGERGRNDNEQERNERPNQGAGKGTVKKF